MPLTAGSSIVLKSTENQSADCTDFLANSFTLKLKQSVPSLFKQNHSRAGLSAAIQSEESVSYRQQQQQQQQQHHVELLSCKQNETELNNKSPVVCSKLVLKSNVEADEGVLNPKSCTESTGLNRTFKATTPQREATGTPSDLATEVNKSWSMSTKRSDVTTGAAAAVATGTTHNTSRERATVEIVNVTENSGNSLQLAKPTLRISDFSGSAALRAAGKPGDLTGASGATSAKLQQLNADYEIIEHLLIDDLDPEHKFIETSNLKQSIKDLKLDFEKKLEAKKYLIQNLNLTGSGLTIVKKSSVSVNVAPVNGEGQQQQQQQQQQRAKTGKASDEAVGERLMQPNKQQTKFAASSGPRNHSGPATGSGAVDAGSKQSVSNVRNRKLIFKRNFSDESESDVKLTLGKKIVLFVPKGFERLAIGPLHLP